MASNHIRVLALVSALAACATSAPGDVRFELGAAEFPGGDEIVVDHVASSTGDFSPGAVVTVRGRYVLASRATGRLVLGTTESTQSTTESDGFSIANLALASLPPPLAATSTCSLSPGTSL